MMTILFSSHLCISFFLHLHLPYLITHIHTSDFSILTFLYPLPCLYLPYPTPFPIFSFFFVYPIFAIPFLFTISLIVFFTSFSFFVISESISYVLFYIPEVTLIFQYAQFICHAFCLREVYLVSCFFFL